ncbi:MAG: hypothetical protein IJT97_02415 [Bacteroidaceae bacterium]|nr:hypothetical protein [Bacteroidaceae bacterium]
MKKLNMKRCFFRSYDYLLSLLLCALGFSVMGCSHTKRMVKGDAKGEIEMRQKEGKVKALYGVTPVDYRKVDVEGMQFELKQ